MPPGRFHALLVALVLWCSCGAHAQFLRTKELVMTDLQIVHGATEAEAKAQCVQLALERKANWLVTGQNLNTTRGGDAAVRSGVNTTEDEGDDAFVLLCMRQDSVESVRNDPPDLFVVQSVDVLAEDACPSAMVEFYQPRNGVVTCLKLVPTFIALGSGLYVSDMTTVQSLMDRSEILGWSTLDTSIQTNGRVTTSNTTSNEPVSVFLAFKRPVRRVRNVKVRSNIHRKNHVKACRTKYGETWEEAGPGFLVEDDDRITILCVERGPSPISFERVLVNVSVATSTVGCPRGFEDPLELSES
ncbi:hypothetical protein Poli38472_008274 [Pythium oligandrum]|uniref:Uncharacterized protein n=1 Tax=Pythium oligandrum TaxID=41045 RepID=A0A8K1CLE4_PYTOL|nr:hypothetical protein Poli38472_008274 [Pythium oligandrum]|eukprot:TMW65632.1 hypothetical protein Poli38472_008274 [Pythium oligandrum]